jgi:hypothetical protein
MTQRLLCGKEKTMESNEKTKATQGSRSNKARKAAMPAITALDDPHNVLLNEKQAADFLNLTDRALQQRRYFAQPPAYIKLPGSSAVRYRLSVLMDFVAAGEVPLP